MRNFLSWLIPGYKNYWTKAFDFKGKTTRIEYWATELVATFAYFIVSFLALLFSNPSAGFGDVVAIKTVWTIVNFAPRLAIIFRRLRDTGSSIWWAVAAVIAGSTTKVIDYFMGTNSRIAYFLFVIIVFFLCCKPSLREESGH